MNNIQQIKELYDSLNSEELLVFSVWLSQKYQKEENMLTNEKEEMVDYLSKMKDETGTPYFDRDYLQKIIVSKAYELEEFENHFRNAQVTQFELDLKKIKEIKKTALKNQKYESAARTRDLEKMIEDRLYELAGYRKFHDTFVKRTKLWLKESGLKYYRHFKEGGLEYDYREQVIKFMKKSGYCDKWVPEDFEVNWKRLIDRCLQDK